MDETRLIFPFSLKEREIEMKKRVYTLYRVSTKGQVEKDDIPMQKEACRNFAESQGWEIVKEFSEKGVSGFCMGDDYLEVHTWPLTAVGKTDKKQLLKLAEAQGT